MNFMLIGGPADSEWGTILRHALAPLGEVTYLPSSSWHDNFGEKLFEVVIIDASNVDGVEQFVRLAHTEQPSSKIVVVTASPTWQRARAAFYAGATDYIPKILNEQVLQNAFKKLLDKPQIHSARGWTGGRAWNEKESH